MRREALDVLCKQRVTAEYCDTFRGFAEHPESAQLARRLLSHMRDLDAQQPVKVHRAAEYRASDGYVQWHRKARHKARARSRQLRLRFRPQDPTLRRQPSTVGDHERVEPSVCERRTPADVDRQPFSKG
jgi:hypothetical protein